MAVGRATSARKAHVRMAPEDGIRRGVEPRLLVLSVRLLVLCHFGALVRWIQGAIPPLSVRCSICVAQSSPSIGDLQCFVNVKKRRM